MQAPLHKELVEQLESAYASYTRTILGMGMLGIFVGSNTYYLAATGRSNGRGWVAAALTMGICLALGGRLGIRRSGAVGLIREEGEPRLADVAVGMVLDELGPGGGAGRVAEVVARFSAADAEEAGMQGNDGRLMLSLRRHLFEKVGQVVQAGLGETGDPAEARTALRAQGGERVEAELSRVGWRMAVMYVVMAMIASTVAGMIVHAI